MEHHMREILSAEQPCILCGQLLEIVTVSVDPDTDEERIERDQVPHDASACLSFLRLYQETWPPSAVNSP
jgi:hypothetical protein